MNSDRISLLDALRCVEQEGSNVGRFLAHSYNPIERIEKLQHVLSQMRSMWRVLRQECVKPCPHTDVHLRILIEDMDCASSYLYNVNHSLGAFLSDASHIIKGVLFVRGKPYP